MAEEYPPYCYREDGNSKGVFIDVVRKIQERIGERSVNTEFYPWARAYKMLKSGIGDMLFPMCMTPERSALFKFVGPVLWDEIYFYKLKGRRLEITSIKDARNVGSIAVTRDDIFHHNLVEMGFENLELSSAQRFDFLKLINGRVDLVPMGRKVLRHFFKCHPDLDAEKLQRVGPPVFFTTIYIAFSKSTPDEVVEKWQAAFDELREEGYLREVQEKYFPED